MKFAYSFQIILLFGVSCSSINGRFDTGAHVKSLGYPFESYELETEDGYLLTLHRIPYGRSNNISNRLPVMLMHGLLGASENWLLGGWQSLAYLAADAGYDVWLPNARGCMHSRKHKWLDPDKNITFWEFSWHEIGIYDMPVFVDFILQKTGNQQIKYVGHSQGCTVFAVLVTERPEYQSKFSVFIGLAPAILLHHIRHELKEIIPFANNMKKTMYEHNQGEFIIYVDNEDLRFFLNNVCEVYINVCKLLVTRLFGKSDVFSEESIPLLMKTVPAGSSVKQFIHFAQIIEAETFRKYDYGKEENMKIYNQTTPPNYNLKNLVIPTFIFSSKGDTLVTYEDVSILEKTLPNVVAHYTMPLERFTHLDFIVAKDLYKLVNKKILRIFKSY